MIAPNQSKPGVLDLHCPRNERHCLFPDEDGTFTCYQDGRSFWYCTACSIFYEVRGGGTCPNCHLSAADVRLRLHMIAPGMLGGDDDEEDDDVTAS